MDAESAKQGPQRDGRFDDGKVGVYLHLPYCDRVCPYCDFAVIAARPLEPAVEARYVAGLQLELEGRRKDFADRTLSSLYFGGGTPSIFGPESIRALVDAVHSAFPSSPAGEIETTLELNPSTLEEARVSAFREAGVNRLSIGIQSFDDGQLKRLGRAHRARVARSTLAAARAAGFENLSLDLIFAGPGQTVTGLDRDLDELLEWSPEHVSTYELTFEAKTPFGRALAAGKIEACDEDRAADMIGQIETRLEGAGFERYEISNYAQPGRRSNHNARYWQRQAVLGLGLGAHSTEARGRARPHGARRANPREIGEWRAALAMDPSAVGELESLSVQTARGEAVFLALRQREGLDAGRFEAEFGAPPSAFFRSEIEAAVKRGWLIEGPEGDLRLSAQGRLFADSVAADFVAAEEIERVGN
ncbi:MAG: radical SAM family heme chaperone HemW [bacterium]|nr:radical SAM family heme chaperone HemW [bacterium]